MYNDQLKGIIGLTTPKTADYCLPVFHLYVIKVEKDRDGLRNYLHEKKIDTGIHYPIPVHSLEAYKELNLLSFPNTTAYAKEIISLPIYPELTSGDIKYVCDQIKQFFTVNHS